MDGIELIQYKKINGGLNMPYNFCEMYPYEIDYKDLETTFRSFPVPFQTSQDKELYRSYIKKWIQVLQESDHTVVEQMAAPGMVNKLLQMKLSEPETFQIPIQLGKNTIFLSFRVSPILHALSHQNPAPKNVPISQLLENEKTRWRQETSLGIHPVTDPIIVVPFPMGNDYQLVIDGNHRLSMLIKQNAKTVPVYYIMATPLVNKGYFSSGFERYFYALLVELNYIPEWVKRGASAKEVISRSLVNSPNDIFLLETIALDHRIRYKF